MDRSNFTSQAVKNFILAKAKVVLLPENEKKQLALKIFNEVQGLFIQLFSRWEDEKGFEDIKEYGQPLQNCLALYGASLVKVTKRPFGFIFTLDTFRYKVKLQKNIYSYSRVR